MSGLLQAPHASQIGDDLGNDAHPRVSSNESQPSSQDDHSHAQATKGSAAATAAASKADASANWRRKAQQDQSAVVQSTIVASAPSTPRVPSDPVAPDVMTIDKLFAKFEKVSSSRRRRVLTPRISSSSRLPLRSLLPHRRSTRSSYKLLRST